jgi:hypothetical protein
MTQKEIVPLIAERARLAFKRTAEMGMNHSD